VTEGVYSGLFNLNHDSNKDGSRTLEIEIMWSNRLCNEVYEQVQVQSSKICSYATGEAPVPRCAVSANPGGLLHCMSYLLRSIQFCSLKFMMHMQHKISINYEVRRVPLSTMP